MEDEALLRRNASFSSPFESGVAGVEAAKLEKFSDADGSQTQWLSDAARNDF